MNLEALKAHFPRETISWRAQSVTKDGTRAMALAYIDARDVMNRLDEVCGPDGWQDEYVETAKGRMICRIGIRAASNDLALDAWIWKSDGAGDTDVEGDKGAISDAFKRAAVKWGIGRYLYDMPTPWVPCETYERGGKHVWLKWKDDPWKYVKAPPAPLARVSVPLPADLEPNWSAAEARDRIKAKLSDAGTVEELAHHWKAASDDLARMKHEDPPKFLELEAAKNAAKARLTEGKAA